MNFACDGDGDGIGDVIPMASVEDESDGELEEDDGEDEDEEGTSVEGSREEGESSKGCGPRGRADAEEERKGKPILWAICHGRNGSMR